MTTRIQRKRTRGYRLPESAIYVGRPTVWGNPMPFDLKGAAFGTILNAANAFRHYAEERLKREPAWLEPLRSHDLACWCPEDAPWCHADVLLELANLIAR